MKLKGFERFKVSRYACRHCLGSTDKLYWNGVIACSAYCHRRARP